MAKLILSFEGTVLRTLALNKERTMIGRRPENDIQIDNLAVSGEHAVIITVHNDSVIEDLNSTNGVVVNGQVIKKQLLKNNDVIEIGKHRLKYVAEAQGPTAYPNFAKTMVIRRPDVVSATPAAAPAPASAATPAVSPQLAASAPDTVQVVPTPRAPAAPAAPVRTAELKILSGPGAGKVLELNKSIATVGKAGVQTAVFTRRPMGFFVTHVEGDSFPLFNGEPLGPQPRQLNDNDTIEIAGIKLTFFNKA